MSATGTLAALWNLAELPGDTLENAILIGADPVLPSSFAVGTAAQTSVAAAALAAVELGHVRGQPYQQVSVDMTHAALECSGWFSLDGVTPNIWDKFSGLYRCADGWVRIHANFAHHRDGALRLLGLLAETAQRADAERELLSWRALDFEQAAADAGLVVAACRCFAEWDAHPQGQAVAALPLFTIERIGDAEPRTLSALNADDRPLTGLRVLDLTRILAGPVCGRMLAAYGADVMLINSPHLPNIESIADTSRGKLSAHADLRTSEGRDALKNLLATSHVFVQGYRPGALTDHGLARTTRHDCARASFTSRSARMATLVLGARGGASIHWCRPRLDSIWPKPRPQVPPNRKHCQCRFSTTPPATSWRSLQPRLCVGKRSKAAVGTSKFRLRKRGIGCAASAASRTAF